MKKWNNLKEEKRCVQITTFPKTRKSLTVSKLKSFNAPLTFDKCDQFLKFDGRRQLAA